MAISTLSPHVDDAPAPIEDPVSFEDVALIFQQTGLREFRGSIRSLVAKLQRWAKEDGLRTERQGRALLVSYTDLAEAHNRRFPAPGR